MAQVIDSYLDFKYLMSSTDYLHRTKGVPTPEELEDVDSLRIEVRMLRLAIGQLSDEVDKIKDGFYA